LKQNRWICLAITGVLFIGIALLLWQEFSFVLGGFGIVFLGFSAMDYIHKK
jgi:hypothetical protein